MRPTGLTLLMSIFFVLNFNIPPAKAYNDNKSIPVLLSGANDTIIPYEEIVSSCTASSHGLFAAYKSNARWFLEITDSLFNRDILIVSRISKGGADVRGPIPIVGSAGGELQEKVIRFVKGSENTVLLNEVSYSERSFDTTDPFYHSLESSNMLPIVGAFPIKGTSRDHLKSLIDVTDFFNSDNDLLYFNTNGKTFLRLSGILPDRSFVENIDCYPSNTEVTVIKSYSKLIANAPGSLPESGSSIGTVEVNVSMILLPSLPMKPREADERVGYFTVNDYTSYDAGKQGFDRVKLIKRWRLEPCDKDKDKYLSGELVEPQKPIVFYIDPATPKKWIPYLMQGVNDWQKAFETAGFKNAICAREAPTKNEDSTWSLFDSRHSVILYVVTEAANARGPSIADPRTGEILESHIEWYHAMTDLLQRWYFIQAAATDSRARKLQFDDSLMGKLIRVVCSHEVGHTLGLRHNFGASSTVPTEKLRDKQWVEANGFCPSIMDYARFNYVAQPQDSISEKGIIGRIGDYDKWAINWGYRWYTQLTEEREKVKLRKWVTQELSSNSSLYFGHEFNYEDPRCQSGDLGDDAIKAGNYGIENLKLVMAHLVEWLRDRDDNFETLMSLYGDLTNQFSSYLQFVVKNIGGIMTTPRGGGDNKAAFEFVSKERQKAAMQFLDQQLFKTPSWLINKEIYPLIGKNDERVIVDIQATIISHLLDPKTIDRLLDGEHCNSQNTYTVYEMLTDLKKSIWTELGTNMQIDTYRRDLQKAFIEKLISLNALSGGLSRRNDAIAIVQNQIDDLIKEISSDILKMKDKNTVIHLKYCLGSLKGTEFKSSHN